MRLSRALSRVAIALLLVAVLQSCGGDKLKFSEPKQSPLVPVARGLSCIHCLHPNAFLQAEQLVEVLFESKVQRPVMNFLVDGSFGLDHSVLEDLMFPLTLDGREPIAVLYLTNGASQRQCMITPVEGFATNICPREFRDLIQFSPFIRSEYVNLVSSVLPTIDALEAEKIQVIIVPGLEDNLTNSAFDELFALTREALPARPVDYARNPCPGCYSGNETGLPSGVLLETHTIAPADGEIVTNDGRDVSLEVLSTLRDLSADGQQIFILWDKQRQGLTDVPVDPDLRDYPLLEPEEQTELTDWLAEY